MISIYNKSNRAIYSAYLRWWNESECCYDQDILEDVDTDLAKKWDSTIDMYVMNQAELVAWEDFWIEEVSDAIVSRSDLLDEGDYNFCCVKED